MTDAKRLLTMLAAAGTGLALVGCGAGAPAAPPGSSTAARTTTASAASRLNTRAKSLATASRAEPLPYPAPLKAFTGDAVAVWLPAGRLVNGTPAVYETTLIPPGGTHPAGIAWLDMHLLSARLYSGSLSPGGGPYRFTAPIQPAQARTLVAAFNGGFQMKDARGGYYTEGKLIDPLRPRAASLVIYEDGTVAIGAWGSDVTMTSQVVSVRQNLTLLVAAGRPTPQAETQRWKQEWGNTCGATSCSHNTPSVQHQWRSGLGSTANGALVYVTGPDLAPLQLAELLVRAGATTAMQLDINPHWPVFASYDPPAGQPASPGNGAKLLTNTAQGPATFFNPKWARDFITLSAR